MLTHEADVGDCGRRRRGAEEREKTSQPVCLRVAGRDGREGGGEMGRSTTAKVWGKRKGYELDSQNGEEEWR